MIIAAALDELANLRFFLFFSDSHELANMKLFFNLLAAIIVAYVAIIAGIRFVQGFKKGWKDNKK